MISTSVKYHGHERQGIGDDYSDMTAKDHVGSWIGSWNRRKLGKIEKKNRRKKRALIDSWKTWSNLASIGPMLILCFNNCMVITYDVNIKGT